MLALWGDDAATSSSAQNQTLCGQRQERLAHDRSGDAELLLQLRLRGQLASSGQAALRDAGPQYRAELAVQRSIPTGVDRVLAPDVRSLTDQFAPVEIAEQLQSIHQNVP